MPQDRPIPGSASDWLARAKGDMALARGPLPEGAFLEDLCFHAQQAAEKATKALYIHHGIVFRYTHDLDELFAGLKKRGIRIPDAVEDSILLTGYAWEARYPGVTEPVTEEEYRKAVRLAEEVIVWAEKELVGARGSSNTAGG
ncbi:MAG: HEPN domain-containing protein [bacterium]